jgi:4-hydroxy-tetrahydrodipicolinate synthase
MVKELKGVFAVLPTAMTESEDFDEAAYRRHIRYLIDVGKVHGIVACGSTGEFAALTVAERQKVIAVAVNEAGGKVPVMAGTAACSTREAVLNSQQAEKAGVDAILLVHPYYSAPSEREMDEHVSAVARSIGVPVMIYNNPYTTHYDMPAQQLARLSQIKNVAYIKESSGGSKRVSEILNLCGDRMTVFCGDDLLPYETFALGGKGWVSVAANVYPRQCVDLFNAIVVKRDLAKGLPIWRNLWPLCHLLESSGRFIEYAKAACELQGRPIGPPRRPFLRPTSEEIQALQAVMDKVLD